MEKRVTYNPAIFNVRDLTQAKGIILTPGQSTTEERWMAETPFLADLIGKQLAVTADMVLVDYGCGIGRLARELIVRHGCQVIGVDISASMRALAADYVGSERFFSCSPAALDTLLERGVTVDAALMVWVLQHCLKPEDDIARLRRALRPDGRLFVLNNIGRAVPTVEAGWVNDSIDIKALLDREFVVVDQGNLPVAITTEKISRLSFWAQYRQLGDRLPDSGPP